MPVKFRDTYHRDESKLVHCAHVISRLDEKKATAMKWSPFKSFDTELVLNGTRCTPEDTCSSLPNICLGVESTEPVFSCTL